MTIVMNVAVELFFCMLWEKYCEKRYVGFIPTKYPSYKPTYSPSHDPTKCPSLILTLVPSKYLSFNLHIPSQMIQQNVLP